MEIHDCRLHCRMAHQREAIGCPMESHDHVSRGPVPDREAPLGEPVASTDVGARPVAEVREAPLGEPVASLTVGNRTGPLNVKRASSPTPLSGWP